MTLFFQLLCFVFCFINVAIATPPQFLIITDIHYGSKNNSQDGQDTGTGLLVSAFSKVKQLSKQVDFIFNLGDLPTHGFFSYAKKDLYEQAVFHGMYLADAAEKPMFYITGNNDSLAGNYQRFAIKGKSPLTFASDWSGACAYCNGLIIDETHMRSEGYYSSYVIPGNKNIILIALNSILWADGFFVPRSNNQEQSALAELAWFEQQLKKHSAKQLLIAMHIPPGYRYDGMPLWKTRYLKHFVQLLEQYAHSYGEMTLITGHVHMDEIRKIPLSTQLNIYDYGTPSVSPIHHNNPGMKVITLNNNMAIQNYTTYYTTSTKNWGNKHYQALGSAGSIFPKCENKNLAQCLDLLTEKQVCDFIEQGFFLGAKSKRIIKNRCHTTYPVINNVVAH